ncbi:hypothetical protein B566_EDAN000154 [Ephemera danica]|nr:hypothetical protein B566_EDAN000154 [Ephemera danica]
MEDLVIEEEGTSSALTITLGDFLVFINWMNQTEKALERAEALPAAPQLDSSKVRGWIQLVQRLEERFRRSEEKKLALEANVIAQEAQLGQLLSHLHSNIASLYENLGHSQKADEGSGLNPSIIKLLLVEDNDVDAHLTRDILAEWSIEQFDITHVTRLSDAFAHLARDRYDAILLDLSLPDAYGLPTLKQVQATSPTIPIIVLSGVSDQTLSLQAVQQGAQDYLVKGQGHPELLARSIRYAIERKRAEERMTYLAQYDQLTGLVNRTLFRDRLIQAMARSKRLQRPLGLMLLDLDRFKTVNDTMGHDVGDWLLKTVADRLKLCIRDEFTIILEGCSAEQDIPIVAQRITESLEEPFELGQHRPSIGVSIGITIYPSDDHDIDDLLKHADAAMYRAKQKAHLYAEATACHSTCSGHIDCGRYRDRSLHHNRSSGRIVPKLLSFDTRKISVSNRFAHSTLLPPLAYRLRYPFLKARGDWLGWRRPMKKQLRIGILIAVSALLFSPNIPLAAQGQMQDSSRRLYDRVMDEFKHRDYEAALAGFRFFIEVHGHSTLAANAQYWIGECQYRLGRYKDSLASFYNVISYYPLSPKLAASTLKIGQAYTKLGDQDKARMMFERVVDQYPDTPEAELARKSIDTTNAKSESVSHALE